ncbi:hypothetical protein XENORESO_009477 [Xenotaenia resolanae]|uniref:Uncharacterized protein n=1 Tax=Xenotaenia resolanae TaxID=208358 RepID=A0ABV0X2P0_9TELE
MGKTAVHSSDDELMHSTRLLLPLLNLIEAAGLDSFLLERYFMVNDLCLYSVYQVPRDPKALHTTISHPPIHTLTAVRLPYTGATGPADHHHQVRRVKCLAQGLND